MNKPIKEAFFRRRLSAQQKINFTRHLAIIIKAGLPLLEGLRIIRRQTDSITLRSIVDQLIEDTNNGQSLANSLKRYQSVFGNFYISIIEVGETSGTLADNLLYLADEMKKNKGLRSKVRSAMIYPAILLGMTVVVCGFLAFYIFPKLLTAFASLSVELPITTRILIAALDFLRGYLLWIVGGFFALFILMRFLMRYESFKYGVDSVFLRIPVVSSLVVNTAVANFGRILGLLLKSGIKIVEAVIIVSYTFDNLVYRRALQEAAEEIKKGASFAQFLAKKKTIFPVILSAMIEVGENTGNLEDNLIYLSDYYTEEVDTSLKNVTSLIEPIILIIMGLIVGFVALSIITPIYSITQSLSK